MRRRAGLYDVRWSNSSVHTLPARILFWGSARVKTMLGIQSEGLQGIEALKQDFRRLRTCGLLCLFGRNKHRVVLLFPFIYSEVANFTSDWQPISKKGEGSFISASFSWDLFLREGDLSIVSTASFLHADLFELILYPALSSNEEKERQLPKPARVYYGYWLDFRGRFTVALAILQSSASTWTTELSRSTCFIHCFPRLLFVDICT